MIIFYIEEFISCISRHMIFKEDKNIVKTTDLHIFYVKYRDSLNTNLQPIQFNLKRNEWEIFPGIFPSAVLNDELSQYYSCFYSYSKDLVNLFYNVSKFREKECR